MARRPGIVDRPQDAEALRAFCEVHVAYEDVDSICEIDRFVEGAHSRDELKVVGIHDCRRDRREDDRMVVDEADVDAGTRDAPLVDLSPSCLAQPNPDTMPWNSGVDIRWNPVTPSKTERRTELRRSVPPPPARRGQPLKTRQTSLSPEANRSMSSVVV